MGTTNQKLSGIARSLGNMLDRLSTMEDSIRELIDDPQTKAEILYSIEDAGWELLSVQKKITKEIRNKEAET